MIRFFLLINVFFIGINTTLPAQENDTLPAPIIVGVKESPPFIFKNESGELTGISIELWEEIAQQLNLTYEYREANLTGILNALEQDSFDLSINPLTVTSDRIKSLYFTQPFYVSNSAVVTRVSGLEGLAGLILQFFSINFLKAVLLLFLVVFIFGFLVWFFEHRHNPDQFEEGWKGLWSGIWWSAVTMTTVGYGDKAPQSTGGRIVALVWMFTAIIIISGFTASIASSLTVNQLGSDIEDLNELRKIDVGTVKASATESFLEGNYIATSVYDNLESGLEHLQSGKIDAFVYDEPILRYYIRKNELNNLIILPFKFNSQYYSFALPKGSDLRDAIDPVLVRIVEDNDWKVLLSQYDLNEL